VVKVKFTCEARTKAKFKGVLDIANDSIIGEGRVKQHGVRALAVRAFVIGLAAVTAGAAVVTGGATAPGAVFTLRSPSFRPEGGIPSRFTCEGADVSPALAWSGAPERARAFVLIVDDPDAPDPAAPKTTWVHWVLYDLPGDASGLPEAVAPSALPAGTRVGLNDWKRTGYGGPCPPIGRHRYVHKLYALDAMLGDLGRATKSDVETAMRGHVVGEAVLIGTYEKGSE
jgi:Raf kinase inhibitor-like YbhB/YbcL family protein